MFPLPKTSDVIGQQRSEKSPQAVGMVKRRLVRQASDVASAQYNVGAADKILEVSLQKDRTSLHCCPPTL